MCSLILIFDLQRHNTCHLITYQILHCTLCTLHGWASLCWAGPLIYTPISMGCCVWVVLLIHQLELMLDNKMKSTEAPPSCLNAVLWLVQTSHPVMERWAPSTVCNTSPRWFVPDVSGRSVWMYRITVTPSLVLLIKLGCNYCSCWLSGN